MQLQKAAYRAGIHHRIALQKLSLTSKNWHKHLEWAKANRSTDWKRVLFTNKAAVKVGYWPGHTWKQPGSANQWDPAENLTAVRYCDWIIDGLLWDTVTAVSAYPDGLSVVKDGSSCHQAAICKQRRAEYNIKMQEHPLALPDLNPIENIWYVFKNLLGKHLPVPKTRDELARAAEEVWNTQITLEHINPVIDLMEHRVEQVLTKQGGPLKY
ncbi:uncharacterized protein UHOD_12212 [Ustilago sp. UG-2017b]|nr:uncharacterized protein UHOD_12212 [Ustilago sp. UG-2017b]